jgi:hypothetical protein
MDIQKLPNWLRWLIVPVAVISTFIVVENLTRLSFLMQGKILGLSSDSWLINVLKNTFCPGITGFLTVFAGVYISPNRKKIVAIVIGALMLRTCWMGFFDYLSEKNWWGMIFNLSLALGVCIYIYTAFKKNTEKIL